MFKYARKDQTKTKPETQIEKIVSMPKGMQPIPPPIMESKPTSTCIYPTQPSPPPNLPCTIHHHMSKPMPATDVTNCHNDMEIAYLKKMYPPVCQKVQQYIDKELNQYDHELSPIYEMYPSQESVSYMANCIYNHMKGDLPNVIKEYECNRDTRAPMGGSFYTLIYALLLNELYRKRMYRRLSPAYSHFADYY